MTITQERSYLPVKVQSLREKKKGGVFNKKGVGVKKRGGQRGRGTRPPHLSGQKKPLSEN